MSGSTVSSRRANNGPHVRLAFSIFQSFLAYFSTINPCFSTIPVLSFLDVRFTATAFLDWRPLFFDDEYPEHKSHSLPRGDAPKRQSTCRVDGTRQCTKPRRPYSHPCMCFGQAHQRQRSDRRALAGLRQKILARRRIRRPS